ncbi:peroxiredoxin [Nitrosomonas sp.]|uniref:peroxiredoxin family protein n=1 Tax=Nitrosomonas sp. TaxID=42353 RepID=UPI00272F37F8|nr:TlpA disulfide reductase family protein [Nitrosomonas sp.]MDP2223861.1 TlpA disulfide reductase family protein [Nitrosomonas sp.]
MKASRYWIGIILLLILPFSVNAGHSGPRNGEAMPDVTLTDFHGKPVALSQDFKGKVVLVRFWSLDCSYCDKAMLVSLENFYHKYKDKGFVPVAINTSRVSENDERVKKLEQLTYPMLLDEYGLVAKKFGVIGLPTTFVFDEAGILRGKITGEAGADGFEKLFTTVLYKGGFYENNY